MDKNDQTTVDYNIYFHCKTTKQINKKNWLHQGTISTDL